MPNRGNRSGGSSSSGTRKSKNNNPTGKNQYSNRNRDRGETGSSDRQGNR